MKLRLSRLAARDLEAIVDYLSAENPAAAERVLAELEAAFAKLGEFPQMGHRRPDLTSRPLLFWQVFSYLVVYRPGEDRVEVARVLHSARDVRFLLDH
jgi:plasmid stabilization system protein ParE